MGTFQPICSVDQKPAIFHRKLDLFPCILQGVFSPHGGPSPVVLTSTRCTYFSWEVGLFPVPFVVTKKLFFLRLSISSWTIFRCFCGDQKNTTLSVSNPYEVFFVPDPIYSISTALWQERNKKLKLEH